MSIYLFITHPNQPSNNFSGTSAHDGVGDLGCWDSGVLEDGVGVKPDLPKSGLCVSQGALDEMSFQVSAQPLQRQVLG